VRLVIADTSPINYLLLIGHIDVLPALSEKVILPAAVRDELSHPKAPAVVRNWISAPPPWVEVRPTPTAHDRALEALDAGEEAAILLAVELHADLLLMDDDEGAVAARTKGLEVTGTLGVLSRAAQRHLLDLREAFDRLRRTNFRFRQEVMDGLLKQIDK
jgi:predicted nucleic acid-binding protein